MSTLKSHVSVIGFTPALSGTAAAESTTLDQGPGLARELTNNGPDALHVHSVVPTDDGHQLGQQVVVAPGDRHTIETRVKLASPGLANVVVSGPVKR